MFVCEGGSLTYWMKKIKEKMRKGKTTKLLVNASMVGVPEQELGYPFVMCPKF